MVAVAVLGLAGSGAVAQGVSFSGSAGMGVKYTGDMENDAGDTTMKSTIDWISDFDIAISASGTTDGGLTFGASTAVEAGQGGGDVTDSEVYIGGESWQVKIGDLDPASHMGRSLGDVGFDGLDVDDVAEKAVTSTHANVEVSFSLGAASLAITAGQTEATAFKKGTPRMTRIYTVNNAVNPSSGIFPTGGSVIATVADGVVFMGNAYDHDSTDTTPDAANEFYIRRNEDGNAVIYQKVGEVDKKVGESGEDNPATEDTVENNHNPDIVATDALLGATDMLVRTENIMGVKDTPAGKQDTVWATGVSFDIGSTTLGIGIDSEKLMQASVSADLGAFTGKLFYAQQKVNENKTNESKNTGMGVEIGVSAGTNTTINAVYAQGKTDYKSATMDDKTDKGFGVGVSHGLGGGATLNAGFAKVKKVTKASVGVSMSF